MSHDAWRRWTAKAKEVRMQPLADVHLWHWPVDKGSAGKRRGKIILGIGGSATNDGGIGMAAALGYRFCDSKRKALLPVGGNLDEIASIDSREVVNVHDLQIAVARDVKNRLLGPEGTIFTYGPQKGADAAMVGLLEKGLHQ